MIKKSFLLFVCTSKKRTNTEKGEQEAEKYMYKYMLCAVCLNIYNTKEIKKNLIFVKTNKNGEIKKAGDPKRAHVPLS